MNQEMIVGLGMFSLLIVAGISVLLVGWDERRGEAQPESFFGSAREKRLWLWVLAALVAIYSTLGLAQEVAAFLRDRNLLRMAVGVLFVGAGVVFVTRWLKSRPGRKEIGIGLGVAAAYLMVLIRTPIPEERTHLFEYTVLAVLIHEALRERQSHGRHVPVPALLAIFATILLGWVDEGIQYFLPDRVYDVRDVVFNSLAAVMAVGSNQALRLARRWRKRND